MTLKPRKRFAQAALAMAATLTFALLACEMPLPFEGARGSPPSMAAAAADEPGSGERMVFVQERPEPENPTDGFTVRVRESYSESSLEENLQPLVYVDGVLVDRGSVFDLGSLDPETIDRVEVLKGDTATDAYGEEAAGGVIHIYLKTSTQRQRNDVPEG